MEALTKRDTAAIQLVRTDFGVGQEMFELSAGEEIIGALRCFSLPVKSADAEIDGMGWAFESDGMFRLRVREQVSNCVIATYERRSAYGPVRGMLRLDGGRQLCWIKESGWGEAWLLTTEMGEPVARFREQIERHLVAEVAGGAESEPGLPLLLLLGFYLRGLSVEEEKAEAKREERRRGGRAA